MKLIILFVLTILMLLFINLVNTFLMKKKVNIINTYFLILTLCIPFSIGVNIHDIFLGGTQIIRINYVFIAIFSIFLISININYFRLTLVDFLSILFLVFIIINSFNNKIYEISKLIDLLTLYLSMYLLFVIYKNIDKIGKSKIISSFSYVAIINGSLSILQYVTGKKWIIGAFDHSIIYTEGIIETKRAIGIAGTNNAAGNLAAILFSVCLYNYMNKKSKTNLLAVILTIVAAILSFTRIAYLAIFIEIIIYFFISNWKNIRNIISKLKVLFFIGLPSCLLVFINIEKIINKLFLERGNTHSYRFFQYNNVVNYLNSQINLFDGIGIGQYSSYLWNNYGIKEIDLHSQLANILVEQGILALVIFVIINLIIILNVNKSSKTELDKAFLWSLVLSNLLCSNFNPNQYYYINNIIYSMLLLSMTSIRRIINN